MTTHYQKITNEIKLKDGYYHPKYSNKRLAISEEDFIEKVSQSQIRLKDTFDEHSLIQQFQQKAEATSDIFYLLF